MVAAGWQEPPSVNAALLPTILGPTFGGHLVGWLIFSLRERPTERAIAEFTVRDLHLVKKALAIAVLAIDRMPGPFQSGSDMTDLKGLLDQLIESDVELDHYVHAARIAVTGEAT